MTEIASWIGFAAGGALLVATFGSVINTIILPRQSRSRISYFAWQAVRRAFFFVANLRPRYEEKDRVLALLGPVALLATLAVWLLLLLLGYALLFWPLVGGDFGQALRQAGSSLFTLGVASSPRGGPTALEFAAAATGMIVVALQIGYLPTIYGAYNRREILVTSLRGRAGAPSWGPEILVRHHLSQITSTLPALYAQWEALAADIGESHASYPWLMAFRSPDPLQHWVTSLLAMLDSAALYLAVAPALAPPEARPFLRAGFLAMRTLARVGAMPVDEDPRPDGPLNLTFEQFAWGVDHLRQMGFPVERTADEAWPDFRGWRVNYERAAYGLADLLVAVPAPWSGPRRQMADHAGVDVLSRRPRHRTPADPEGQRILDATALALQRERALARWGDGAGTPGPGAG